MKHRKMKTFYILGIALVFLFGTNACAVKNAFTVEGKIDGLKDGTVMEMVLGATHQQEDPIAVSVVQNSKFAFTYSVESPRLFYIREQGVRGNLRIVAENGDRLRISGKVEYEGDGDERWADFSNAEIKGSPLTDEYERKMAFRKEQGAWQIAYREENKDVIEELTNIRRSNDKTKLDSLMKSEEYKKLVADEGRFFHMVDSSIYRNVMDNKNTWWGPLLMLTNLSWFEEEQREWYAAFPPKVQESYYGQLVRRELPAEPLDGKLAPAFIVKDDNGSSFTLQQLMEGKKYVLIDFWASWCGPCRQEIPNLKKQYERFASKGLQIISISLDQNEAAWKKALDEEKLPWLNFRDNTGIDKAYGVRTIPAIFLVDANGVVVATGLRGKALQEKLVALFP